MMLVLTHDELKEITGAGHRVKMRAELDALGIPYRVNSGGWPVVLRDVAMEALGAGASSRPAVAREATLDLSFLDK